MAKFNAKFIAQFEWNIWVELYPIKKKVDCKAYFGSTGQLVSLEIFLQKPYEGRKYTIGILSDEIAVISRAKSMFDAGQVKQIDKEIDTNDDTNTHEIRKKDLISSRSFTRTASTPTVRKTEIISNELSDEEDAEVDDELSETSIIEKSESSAIEPITEVKPRINRRNKFKQKSPTLDRIYEIIKNNNNEITSADICKMINVGKTTVIDAIKKLKIVRTLDASYKGKGQKFLLSIPSVNSEYQPHSMG